jgi:hypothetical protein
VNCIVVGIHLSHCFTINISGETYIEPGVPYKVTCTVSQFLENRRTTYSAIISSDDITRYTILDSITGGCNYKTQTTSYSLCQSSICSCDMNGLATHWTYNTPTDLVTMVTFRCESIKNETNLINSEALLPTIPSKCLVFRVNKSCYSEGRQLICLKNYVYLDLRYTQLVLVVSHIHVRYVSISSALSIYYYYLIDITQRQ